MLQTVVEIQFHRVVYGDHVNVGDVGKSPAFCKAPDEMICGKKRTRKSVKGKKRG